jgi:hypothetical protein
VIGRGAGWCGVGGGDLGVAPRTRGQRWFLGGDCGGRRLLIVNIVASMLADACLQGLVWFGGGVKPGQLTPTAHTQIRHFLQFACCSPCFCRILLSFVFVVSRYVRRSCNSAPAVRKTHDPLVVPALIHDRILG